jgi:UDP-hydrolysing UDP-N-acetyl-D-glucosamine 2-epimerase
MSELQKNDVRKVLVVTVGRSDFGISRPILDRIAETEGLEYSLLVSGAHLSRAAGYTVREIEAESRPIYARVELPDSHGSEEATAQAMAAAVSGTAHHLARERPDIVLVVGDRFETFAVAAATVPFNLPLAHVHGGEVSFGATDDSFRHAITKISHLHFAATHDYANRILQMGEEPWRVHVSGAPSLDNLRRAELPDRAVLASRFNINLDRPPLLVTFHPVTRQSDDVGRQIQALLDALRKVDIPIVITAPNADVGSDVIRSELARFIAERPSVTLVESFGSLNYLAMLRESAAMIGNSSSGLIETPAFALPTINVGDRQDGRTRPQNVIDVAVDTDAIVAGLRRALSPEFREGLSGMANPYGNGTASDLIAKVLAAVEIDARLIAKRFNDIKTD